MLIALALFACTNESPEPQPEPPKAEVKEAPKAAPAPLKLTGGEIKLVQLKNGTAEVPATFSTPSGTLNADGTGTFEIDLSTWDSELDLRNERVRGTFFHATEHPKATFKATSLSATDPALPLDSNITPDAVRTGVLKGELSLYSGSTEVEIPVSLVHSNPTEYFLNTEAPFSVSIESLGLNENLQALMVECAHESIGDSVEVSFNLILTK